MFHMSSYETTKSPFVSTKKKKQLKVVQAIHFVNCSDAGSSGQPQIKGEITIKAHFQTPYGKLAEFSGTIANELQRFICAHEFNQDIPPKRQCSTYSHHSSSICYLTACKQQSCVHVCSFLSHSSKYVLQAPLFLTAAASRNYSRPVLSLSCRDTKCSGVMRGLTQK